MPSNEKDIIKKLLKIAENQQKIIMRLAQDQNQEFLLQNLRNLGKTAAEMGRKIDEKGNTGGKFLGIVSKLLEPIQNMADELSKGIDANKAAILLNLLEKFHGVMVATIKNLLPKPEAALWDNYMFLYNEIVTKLNDIKEKRPS